MKILACVLALSLFSSLNSYEILPDNAATRTLGYDNCEMKTNGERALLRHILTPSSCVFDVGANRGDWSAAVLAVCPSAALFAFEPIPEVFRKLQKRFPRIRSYSYALSDTRGSADFYHYKANESSARLSGFYDRLVLRDRLPAPKKISVPLETIDHFCAEQRITHIDLLKIDTEGAEWKVLLGAQQMLQGGKIRAIQFEYGGCYIDAKTTLRQVFELLTRYEYSIFRIIPNGLVHIVQWDDALENFSYSNYFAIRKGEKFSQSQDVKK